MASIETVSFRGSRASSRLSSGCSVPLELRLLKQKILHIPGLMTFGLIVWSARLLSRRVLSERFLSGRIFSERLSSGRILSQSSLSFTSEGRTFLP